MVTNGYFYPIFNHLYRVRKFGQLVGQDIVVSFRRSHRSLTIIEKITMRYFVFLEIFVH
jgi:hypothetical protein